MTTTEIKLNEQGRVVPLNEQLSIGDHEGPEDWTNRLLRAAREAGTKRQCSIGWHLECSDPEGEECRCACHPWPQEAIDAPMEMGQRETNWWWEPGIGWQREPETVEVAEEDLQNLTTMVEQLTVCQGGEEQHDDHVRYCLPLFEQRDRLVAALDALTADEDD